MANTKISALTTDTAPDRVADYAPTYDASAVATKKVLLSNFGQYSLACGFLAVSPADSSTYYASSLYASGVLPGVAANVKIRIPRAGKVTAVYIDGSCTTGTSENSTFSFRLNDTTDTTISSTVTFNASPFAFSNTGLGVSVAAGDWFTIKWATPAWVTNPTNINILFQIVIA